MTKKSLKKKLSGKHKRSSLCTLQASATGLPNWMSEVSAAVGYIMASSSSPWTWECTSGGVYVPCIYMHARWEFP